jgi:excisionase family DNA binding protein
MNEYLTIRQVATLLQFSEDAVYKMTANGELPGTKIGRNWRFDKKKLEKWLDEKTMKVSVGR